MTIEELDQENLTLREVIHDLEKQISVYRGWIKRNDIARGEELARMEKESADMMRRMRESYHI